MIVVENPKMVDLDISSKEVNHYFFRVKNTGDSPINLLSALTSCGCMALNPEKHYLPGVTHILEITMDKRNQTGLVLKTVNLVFDNKQKIELIISGTLNPNK